jgi:hypothetical protein
MKGDRRILVGIQPCELEFRFVLRNVWAEANPGQSAFCRVSKWNVNEIHGMERTKLVRESCRSCCSSGGHSIAQRYTSAEILDWIFN